MSLRPVACASCGEPLPINRGAGRPARYCSSSCRYAARRDRDRRRERAPLMLTPPPAPDRAALAASLALLVDPTAAPAAPEDQLGRALLELRVVRERLERIGSALPPRLGAPAQRLAIALRRESSRAFPEIDDV